MIENGQTYQRATAIQQLFLRSSNGLDFELDTTTAERGSLRYRWNNPIQNGFCAAGGWGQGDFFAPSQASLTLEPHTRSALLQVSYAGDMVYL